MRMTTVSLDVSEHASPVRSKRECAACFGDRDCVRDYIDLQVCVRKLQKFLQGGHNKTLNFVCLFVVQAASYSVEDGWSEEGDEQRFDLAPPFHFRCNEDSSGIHFLGI